MQFQYKMDEQGIIFLDVLAGVLAVMILNGFLWSMVQFSWHLYDRSSKQMEATSQVSIFLQQWKNDIEQSKSIINYGSRLHVELSSGGTVDYVYNGSPEALHILRLVNGSGGEVACTHVTNLAFQLDNPKSVRVRVDIANGGPVIHYEGFAISYASS